MWQNKCDLLYIKSLFLSLRKKLAVQQITVCLISIFVSQLNQDNKKWQKSLDKMYCQCQYIKNKLILLLNMVEFYVIIAEVPSDWCALESAYMVEIKHYKSPIRWLVSASCNMSKLVTKSVLLCLNWKWLIFNNCYSV